MRRGFTLIEVVLVVIILAVLAGVVVPMAGGLNEIATPAGPKSDRQIVTETTMLAIRDAIMGTPGRHGMWADMGQRPELFPQRLEILFHETPPAGIPTFNPVTKTGWRGSYFVQSSGKFDLTGLDNSFNDARYGEQDDLTLVDAWGNPIVIQIDFNGNGTVDRALVDYDGDLVPDGNEADFARLVSAGPDGVLDTPYPTDNSNVLPESLTTTEYGDDILLFFGTADTRP